MKTNDKEKEIFEMKFRKRKGIEEPNSTENYQSILSSKNPRRNKFLSNTVENSKKIIPLSPLSTISQFKGFFNKNFNLTKYKKSRQRAFLLSHSIEKI